MPTLAAIGRSSRKITFRWTMLNIQKCHWRSELARLCKCTLQNRLQDLASTKWKTTEGGDSALLSILKLVKRISHLNLIQEHLEPLFENSVCSKFKVFIIPVRIFKTLLRWECPVMRNHYTSEGNYAYSSYSSLYSTVIRKQAIFVCLG